MKLIPIAVTQKVARAILVTQKNSPTLLFGVGVVGVVATTVLAARATLKLEYILEETQAGLDDLNEMEHDGYTDRDRLQDKVLFFGHTALKMTKLYAPTVVVGTVSIAALSGSHVILTRRSVALTAAYAAVEKAFEEYRVRVRGELGPEKDLEFRHGYEEREFIEETKKGHNVVTSNRVAPGVPSMYARFFDECSPSWDRRPELNYMFVRCQQTYANDRLRAKGHLFLNEVYDSLGIERTKAGAVVGWLLSRDDTTVNFVDFGVFNGNSEKARDFVNGREGSILLDFNVDGLIYDKI